MTEPGRLWLLRALALAIALGLWFSVSVEDRDAIRKVYKFRNFVEAFGWMAQGALLAEKMGHHPDWKNVWNRVEVELIEGRYPAEVITPVLYDPKGEKLKA